MTASMIRGVGFRLPGFALAALLAFPCLIAQQPIGPDEVKATTVAYLPTPSLTLRTQVNLVEVPVVVRDSHHKAVAGLEQKDFTLFDAGKKQEITAFSVETFVPGSSAAAVPNASTNPATTPSGTKPASPPKPTSPPRYVIICFDNLSTDTGSLIQTKTAAKQFVKTALAPGDRVAIVSTAWPQSTPFTDDVPTLLALIEKVGPSSRNTEDGLQQCPPMRNYEAYLIANHMDPNVLQAAVADFRACAGANVPRPEETVTSMAIGLWERSLASSRSIMHTVDDLVKGLAKIPGRRMILLASSGFLSGNLESDLDEMITKALHSGVVINSLSARGLYTVIPGGDASEARPSTRTARSQIVQLQTQGRLESAKDDALAVLASGTGGSFYHNDNDLLRGFRELGMVPESMYVLGFTPSDAMADGRYHSLKVRLTAAGHNSLQARMGYSAVSRQASAQPAAPSKVDSAMLASDILADLPASISWEADTQKHGVTFRAHINLNRLKFETGPNQHGQKLTLVAVLRDANGVVVAGKRSELELNLKDATFARLVAGGDLRIALTLEAPPGNYSARGLVQDGLEGKMITSNQELRLQ